MLPFITVFGIKIPMYGLLISAGVALGVFITARFPCKKGIARQDILFASCFAGIGAFAGAKLLYLAITIPQLLQMATPPAFSWELVTTLFSYGFVFYGGAIGGLLGIFIYARKYKINFFNLSEILIPSIPLIHAIGRLGCFCAGCCYGRPMDPPWGVLFRTDSVALQGITLFPIQLLESALNLVLFVGLFAYSRKERFNGQILGFYFIGYGIERFVLEYFRYDEVRGFILGLSTSQWISLLLIPIGLFLLFRHKMKRQIKEK